MQVYLTTTLGLVSIFEFDYVVDDRKTFNLFFIGGHLYFYQSGEDANGKYTITSIRIN